MPKLVVRLLGGFRVESDGDTLYAFESDKGRALLAYLMVEADRPHRRETLAGLLWPDRPDTVARASLRQALSSLRRALADRTPPFFLFVTPSDVQFNDASDHALDVAELEAFARSPARFTELLPESLCADFLAGLAVPDSEAFQAWVLTKQEHFHRLALDILDAQNAHFEVSGDYERAIAAARLQIRMEPWLEKAHRRCMRALALAGRSDEAVHQYEACRRALQAELEVEPSAETDALYADIRAGKMAARGSSAPYPSGSPHRRTSMSPFERLNVPTFQRASATSRLVARADELGQLERRLDGALAGETALVFVSGDAGSGKTALLAAFVASAMARHAGLLVASARCSPGGSQDPFAPLRKLAEMLFGDPGSGVGWWPGGRDQVERLQQSTALALAAISEQGMGLVETLVPASSVARRARQSTHGAASAAFLAGLGKKGERLAQSSLFDQLASTLTTISHEQPLLLLIDDLHWVDDATAAFLLHLGRELSDSRLLLLGAHRSATVALGRREPRREEVVRHPLAAALDELRRMKGEITVDLDRADGRAFVEAYVDSEPNRLGARFRDALYAQTGGHALFTVELLRNLQERGELFKDEVGRWTARESLDWGALPARVEGAIAERIDRLAETERRLLECASVEGDDFSAEMVAELTGLPLSDTLARLSGSVARQHRLVRPERLQRLNSGQRSTYRFTHHLFQKYLYDQLDAVERARLHALVAASLERQCGSDVEERARQGAQLAWHCEQAGLPLQAARALLDAGRQAMRVSALREALDRFEHGLALLANAPLSEERTEIIRLLEVARLGPRRNLAWIGSASVQDALEQATGAWAGRAQGRPKLLMLAAQAEQLLGRGRFAQCLAAAEGLHAEAMQAGEEDLGALADMIAGAANHFMGNVQESERRLDQVLASMSPDRRLRLRAAMGLDTDATALGFSALNRWLLGYPQAALERSRQALAAAHTDYGPVGQAATAALSATLLFFLRNDDQALAERANECRRLSAEHSFGHWRPWADVCLARVMALRGEDVSGIAGLPSDGWRTTGLAIGVDILVVVLADSCLLAASRRENRGLLAKGLAAIDSMLGPDRIPCGQAYQAEMHRLRGALLLARDGLAASEGALECFERALELGREKSLLAWELRAAMSVVRLRQHQGAAYAAELTEARRCLAEVYTRFTEGFGFPDLQEAAALLGEIG